jgi:hypothetical protein
MTVFPTDTQTRPTFPVEIPGHTPDIPREFHFHYHELTT